MYTILQYIHCTLNETLLGSANPLMQTIDDICTVQVYVSIRRLNTKSTYNTACRMAGKFAGIKFGRLALKGCELHLADLYICRVSMTSY